MRKYPTLEIQVEEPYDTGPIANLPKDMVRVVLTCSWNDWIWIRKELDKEVSVYTDWRMYEKG